MDIRGFAYPDDAWFFLAHDMWCRPHEGGCMEVGITAFGVHLSGDFYMCRPKPVGTVLRQGETVAVAELSKAVVSIKSPLSGRVVQVNPLLAETPELVHRDPYGRGWLVRIAPERWTEDLANLAHGESLALDATARMRLEKLR